MKKLFMRGMALCLCVVLCIALAACGSKTKNDPDPGTSPSAALEDGENANDGESANDNENADDNEDANDGEDTGTLEAFVEENKEALDAMLAAYANDPDISIDVTAKGSTLIYNFTFVNGVEDYSGGMTVDEAKEFLDGQLDAQDASFNNQLEVLKDQISYLENIQVNFLNDDGSVITSREY